MSAQPTEIRDFIESNWDSLDNLSDRLSKVPLDNMKEIVRFFDRKQVEGNEWTKAVVVEKINDEQLEDKLVHPSFIERTDKYRITLHYRVVDVQEVSYSEALDDVEEMATELQRILDLQWNPSDRTGVWFLSQYYWEKFDHLDSAQPELVRGVQIRLTNVAGTDDTTYTGFNGILIFDITDSDADFPPNANYTYLAVTNVSTSEGWVQIPYLTKDKSQGHGVPYLGRGAFAGTFTALTYANRENMQGTTIDKIPKIYLPQTTDPVIGEQATVTFLNSVTNNESAPNTMTKKMFMKISRISDEVPDSGIMEQRIDGTLVKQSEVTFS